MKELKGKAEFFQKYIVERYKKLCDLRSVGTNTDHGVCGNNDHDHNSDHDHKNDHDHDSNSDNDHHHQVTYCS